MSEKSREQRARESMFKGWDGSRSGHNTEVERHAGGTFIPVCKTCGWRTEDFVTSEHEAFVEESGHHWRVCMGAHQVGKRTAALGPAIRHARDMAERPTTPIKEREEWLRLADEMDRQRRMSSKERSNAILEGQISLFDTEEGAIS